MKQLLKLTFVLTGILLFSLGCDKNIISSDSELSFSSNASNDLIPEGTINGVKAFDGLPTQLYPQSGDIVDNGCTNRTNPIIWNFSWTAAKGATKYQLYVYHVGSLYPVVNDNNITTISYESNCDGCYIINGNRFDWRWKVRAFVNGMWTRWTPEISFDVEPLNTDC